MWEQIQSNRRKTMVLVVLMAGLLFALGYVIAEAYAPGAGIVGLGMAMVVWVVMSFVAYFQGDSILLAVSGARKIEKADHPQLFNVVEEMTIASGKGKMPNVYIIDDMGMNAFAAGRNPNRASIAVTAGLLGKLNRDELQGVVGHEMAHIVNRDVLLMSMTGVMLGAIVMISEIFLRSLWHSGGSSRRYRSNSKGGGQGAAVVAVVAIVLAILAPILAQLIYFAISRKREYLADAHSAVLTRYPEGLASALEQLSRGTPSLARANKATAPMYIINPLKGARLNDWTSTHPPTSDRINILRSIGGTVSYGAYQAAWKTVSGKKSGKLPASAVREGGAAAVREAHPDARGPRERMREAGDILRKANRFLFLPCPCGLQLKLPPQLKDKEVACPRCNRMPAIPVAELGAMEQIADVLGARTDVKTAKPLQEGPLTLKRRGKGWESFKCACGATKTVSPNFPGKTMRCDSCKREIRVA